MRRRHGLTFAFAGTLALAGCSEDPVYLVPVPGAIEINGPGMMTDPDDPVGQLASVLIPMRLETADERAEREALAERLGLEPDMVPTVRRADVDVAVEWTIKNLEDAEAIATINVLGANEFFRYEPTAFFVGDEDEDENVPASLIAPAPILVPPLGTISGVFREDQLREAALDLEAITRGGVDPGRAVLTRGELPMVPAPAIAGFLQIDVGFVGNRHMVLDYVVRVRDRSGRLRPFCSPMPQNPPEECTQLVMPSQTGFAPPPMTP